MLTKEPIEDQERAEEVRRARHDDRGAAKYLSPCQRDMRLAVAVAKLAETMLDAFYENHRGPCDCEFCQDKYVGDILNDLFGLKTIISMATGILSGEIPYGWRDNVGVTFADDLRDLADEADRVAALHDAEPDEVADADEPAVVTAEGGAR